MVILDRIYTGGGDKGQTSLGDGQRVSKLDLRIAAGGVVDELNCVLGLAMASAAEASDPAQAAVTGLLPQLQQFLFDLGADLCTPLPQNVESDRCPRLTAAHVTMLEQLIDLHVAAQRPLTSFILPGGSLLAAHLHHARAVCRRAELAVLQLKLQEPVNTFLVISTNRLSDLLFVMARTANDGGQGDILWEPGRSLLRL